MFENKKTFVIAESGINHNGSEKIAKKLIESAFETGANAVKFQTYITKNLVTKNAGLAFYQRKNLNLNNQFQMLKKFELSKEIFKRLKKYADKLGIIFLSSPFDLESAEFLIKNLKLKIIKIPSGEITNAPLLNFIGKNSKKIILSTGMSNFKEIYQGLDILAFSMIRKQNPNKLNFLGYFKKFNKNYFFKNKIILMHCISEYPTDLNNINLLRINKLKKIFKLETGYSDHSKTFLSAVVAVSRGTRIIEKHLTLDKKLLGPDHSSSSTQAEFKKMVQSIRLVEKITEKYNKNLSDDEISNSIVSRKSLVATKKIKKGEKLSIYNMGSKRPNLGISPIFFWKILGKRVTKNYLEDEFINEKI